MNNKDVSVIMSLGVSLNSEKNMTSLFQKALDSACQLTESDAAAIYLTEAGSLKPKAANCPKDERRLKASDLPAISLPAGPGIAEILSSEGPVLFHDLHHDLPGREADFAGIMEKKMEESFREAIFVPLKRHDQTYIGFLALFTGGSYEENDLLSIRFLGSQTATAINTFRYIKDAQLTFLSFVETMISAVETLTPYNANHTRNMVTYGINFILYLKGTKYALSEQAGKELVMSIWLHDIGKLCTPVDIMNKNTRLWPIQKAAVLHRMETFALKARLFRAEGKLTGEEAAQILRQTEEVRSFVEVADTNIVNDREECLSRFGILRFRDEDGTELPYLTNEEIHQLSVKYRTLTDEEFEIMHNHVVQTEKLMTSLYFPEEMPHVRDWASAHHELLNGKGYPKHLTAAQIPKEVRILTILDIFEALTATDRDYKKPMTPEDAIAHLHRIAGFGEVDDELVTLFEESRSWE